jgi:hypothetical protein
MKLTLATFIAATIAGTADAMNFRGIFDKKADSAAVAEPIAADEPASEEQGERNLQASAGNCWGDSRPSAAWHPQYQMGWSEGYCRYTVDCNSPAYSTELNCCKGAYAGQISGKCISRLPNPPTSSPTKAGGLDIYYPDYNTAWTEATCINDAPMPSGRPTYTTMLACCKGAYGGQVSGKCLASLPSPPTTSPTPAGGIADFWYPDYDTAWTEAGCLNTFPLPYKNKNDRPNYKTQLACCKGAYGGQMSGKCISQLPSPPTTSPTGAGGLDFYYPDYDTAWNIATCKNDRPLPYTNKNDRPSYKSMLECCKGAYAGQQSGACLAALPSPPTTSPTKSGGLDVFYPDYSKAWPQGVCINDYPMPSGRPTYKSKEACCSGAYGGQRDFTCHCDADPCYSCKCGSKAELQANKCLAKDPDSGYPGTVNTFTNAGLDCGFNDDE